MTLHIPASQISRRRVVVVIPDGTRNLPLHDMLTASLEHLTPHHPAQIDVLVALGLHRAMRDDELTHIAALCRQFNASLIQHDAQNQDVLCTLHPDISLFPKDPASSAGKLPVTLHRAVCEAELIVCLGIVEPHQYAGFSGGVKSLSIGCAGADTIAALHGLEYLRHPLTTLGVLQGNPFREALNRVASHLKAPIYASHYVPPTATHPESSFTHGEVHEAFTIAAAIASSRLFTTHARAYPWAHIPVTGAKGVNFYQASRAATYVGLVAHPVVAPGGVLCLEAACPEGMGEGAGEVACTEMLARGLETLLAELAGRLPVPAHITLTGGAQRAYVIARLLERYRLVLITPRHIEGLAPHLIPQFSTLSETLAHHHLAAHEGITLQNVFHAVPTLFVDR